MKKILFLLFALSLNVQAEAVTNRCVNLNTQTDINICITNLAAQTDTKIGRIYGQYMKKLDNEQRLKLKESQILWIKFKEKDCAFEASSVKGGSMYSSVLGMCLIDRTEKRISELQNMLNFRNGTEPSCF